MDDSKVFRQSYGFLVAGILSLGLGLFFGIPVASHLFTGAPMVLGNGRGNPGSHLSTPGELWGMMAMITPLVLAAIYLVLQWINGVLIMDSEWITFKTAFRTVKFRALWSDLTRLEYRGTNKGQSYYRLYSDERRVTVAGFDKVDPVIAEIRARAPQIQES